MSWIKYDITFCNEACDNFECERNYLNMPTEEMQKPHSYALMKDTEDCIGYIKVGDNENRNRVSI